MTESTIIYTHTDEAPALATASFLPIVRAVARQAGIDVETRDVTLDMKTRMLASQKPIDGTMPLGRFSADRLRANLDTRVIDLDGRVRLHIVQARSRGPR